MDKAKLESLRARYANGNAFDAADPALRRAAAQLLFEEFALMAGDPVQARAS